MKKNHHFVPQFYLRGFLDPVEEAKRQNVLWCYSVGRSPKRFPTSRVGCKELFYGFENEGEMQLWIEDKMAEMERLASGIWQKLASGTINLSPAEREELGSFIAIMQARGEHAFDLVNKLAADLQIAKTRDWLQNPESFNAFLRNYERETGERLNTNYEAMKEFMEAVVSGEVQTQQLSRGWTLKQMSQLMLDNASLFDQMSWGLLEASDGELFLTTDNPVALWDPGRRIKDEGYTERAMFTFPVSRKYCLQGINKRDPFGRRPQDAKQSIRAFDVRQINKSMISKSYKYLYAPVRSDAIAKLQEKIYTERPSALPSVSNSVLDTLVRAADAKAKATGSPE